ncbi:MAG: HAD-IA family hydrolase, partial [Bdellovibrionales bacterium]|nr:HAD-IA family hydrolase [Bdellovibrionales bacterium]
TGVQVSSFLQSRDINLPWGSPDDEPEKQTVCGLGNKKNVLVNKLIDSRGVGILPGSIEFVHHVLSLGLRTAVVSSSKNCEAILKAAGISDLFEVRIDGVVAARRQIPGKPQPDTFLAAAKALEAEPARSIVLEDAISGVQAGKSGGFGLVIGIEHGGQAEALRHNGADVVVADLRELI